MIRFKVQRNLHIDFRRKKTAIKDTTNQIIQNKNKLTVLLGVFVCVCDITHRKIQIQRKKTNKQHIVIDFETREKVFDFTVPIRLFVYLLAFSFRCQHKLLIYFPQTKEKKKRKNSFAKYHISKILLLQLFEEVISCNIFM